VLPTTHHAAASSSGTSQATGATVRSASVRAMWRRTAMSCATWITWRGVCSDNTR